MDNQNKRDDNWTIAKDIAKMLVDDLRQDILNGNIKDPRLIALMQDDLRPHLH
jgi:hypothetical protein